jgi:hypothetical protein
LGARVTDKHHGRPLNLTDLVLIYSPRTVAAVAGFFYAHRVSTAKFVHLFHYPVKYHFDGNGNMKLQFQHCQWPERLSSAYGFESFDIFGNLPNSPNLGAG